jgi:hypothetical protein
MFNEKNTAYSAIKYRRMVGGIEPNPHSWCSVG